MFDFRLKVFHTVAQRGSFTKAAKYLAISQPAVTKHIQEIEAYYQVKLFTRNGMAIALTEAGTILFNYSEDIFSVYRKIAFDIQALNAKVEGSLHLAASTTISQYVLPPLLADFKKKMNNLHIEFCSENTADVEQALLSNRIDIGLVEGESKNAQLKYLHLIDDEIVLVCRSGNPLVTGVIHPKDLLDFSFLLRENGSGTLDVVDSHLKQVGIDMRQLNHEMNFSSTESIKMYLMHSNSFAFLSIHAILKELKYNELMIVDIEGLTIKREFNLIHRLGQQSALEEIFIRFAQAYNFRLS